MKKIFKQIHLWLSVPVGLIIAVICLTGAALVFEQEIIEWQNPRLYKAEYRKGDRPLPPSVLAERIRQQTDTLTLLSLQVSGTPGRAYMASFRETGRKTLSVNPYTGEVNGWVKGNAFFQTMRKLHRWLLDPPPQKGAKSVGKVVVGVTTLLMVVILVTGVVIWWPRTKKALKNRLSVSCTKGWRRFWYDTHVALGLYATLFLLLMALTGLTWSFQWYRTAAYGLFGVSTQRPASPNHGAKEKAPHGKEQQPDYALWDSALAALQAKYPAFTSIRIDGKSAQVTTSGKSSLRRTDTAELDPATGGIKKITTYDEVPLAQKMKGLFYSFHTGTWGGMLTKVLYFLAAFIGGTLPLTGYYLWIKRKWNKKA